MLNDNPIKKEILKLSAVLVYDPLDKLENSSVIIYQKISSMLKTPTISIDFIDHTITELLQKNYIRGQFDGATLTSYQLTDLGLFFLQTK